MSFDFNDFQDIAAFSAAAQRHEQIEQNEQILQALRETNPSSGPRDDTRHNSTAKPDPGLELIATIFSFVLFGSLILLVIGFFLGLLFLPFQLAALIFVGLYEFVPPVVWAFIVGGGLLFLLWKKRSRLGSLFREYFRAKNDGNELAERRIAHETVLRSLCCMMAADGKVIALEQKAARRVLQLIDSPLTEFEVTTAFAEFRDRIESGGFEKELEDTVQSIRTTLSDGNFRETFRRALKRVAVADGVIDTAEKRAAKLMIDALGA